MSPLLRPLYRLHGRLASRWIVRGGERAPGSLRAVRFVLDLVEMAQLYGAGGVFDVFRDRLRGGR